MREKERREDGKKGIKVRKGRRRKGKAGRRGETGRQAKPQTWRTGDLETVLPLDVRKLMIKMSSLKSLR